MSVELPNRIVGLEVHEADDGLVVYDGGTGRVHSLNPSASIVFELCTGERTEAEIATIVGAAWGLADPPTDEVRACLVQLRTEGVIT